MSKKHVNPIDDNDLSSMFAADANVSEEEREELLSSTLGTVSKYIQEQDVLQKEIDELNGQLKEKLDRFRTISEILIPELFDAIQMESVKLKDGSQVTITTKYAAGITKNNEAACFAWLKEHKHEGIISHEIITKLKKGDDKHAQEIMKFLNDKKLITKDKKFVHHSTLAAFVKEQIESEATTKVTFPREIFSVFPVKQTKITRA